MSSPVVQSPTHTPTHAQTSAPTPGHGGYELSDGQVTAVVTLQLVSGFLSLIASAFIIASMVMMKSLSLMSARLVFALAVSSFLYSLSYVLTVFTLNPDEESGFCYFQGMFNNFSANAAFLWTAIISYNLYFVMVQMRAPGKNDEKIYHGFVWGLSAFLTIIPVFTGSYGRKGLKSYWCWIDMDGHGGVMRLISFYIPLYVCIFFVAFMYALVAWNIRRQVSSYLFIGADNDSMKSRADILVAKQLQYPLAFLLIWVFPTINRIHNWASKDEIYWLYIMQALTEPLLGFVNGVIYGAASYKGILVRLGWLQPDVMFALPVDDENEDRDLVWKDDNKVGLEDDNSDKEEVTFGSGKPTSYGTSGQRHDANPFQDSSSDEDFK